MLGGMSTAKPFRIDVPQADLDDLRDWLARTRWPEPTRSTTPRSASWPGTWNGTITHWTQHPRGGHFAVLQVPDLLVADIRELFRGLGPDR